MPYILKAAILALGIVGLTATSAAGQNPRARPDDSWISISGTVVAPQADSFKLDFGNGLVTVEVDDFDRYGEGVLLRDGDRVTVYGRIDDDLFEMTKIEAGSVYVESLNAYFRANSADEEGIENWAYGTPVNLGEVTIRGTVVSVNADEQQFTVNTGRNDVTIDTDSLSYNPLDDYGFQQIDAGDRVSVGAVVDWDFFDAHLLEADSVVTLHDYGAS